MQYVSRLLGGVEPPRGVESGFGTLVVETGVLGLVLWMFWTFHLLRAGWRVLRQLRETPLFPLGFSILWFAFLVLQPFMTVSIQCYQNFVYNAYLWVMIGVLFRLPALVARQPDAPSAGGVRDRVEIAALALAGEPRGSPGA